MLYDITLKIEYAYDSLADAGRHILRLTPATLPGRQRVIASSLDVAPIPTEQGLFFDFFDNRCINISYDGAVEETSFLMKARVDRTALEQLFDVSPSLERLAKELETVNSVSPESPHHFRGRSPRVPQVSEIAAWAKTLSAGSGTALEAVTAICTALHREMTFDPEATAVDTPLEEAFRARHGVCQDFTHIAICALRSIGVPAGYVSGFLRTIPPKGAARLEGADAMHAWVRAWSGLEMGWVEFDPTNNMMAGEDHVVVAVGRDYFDVAPVKGALRTAGSQDTSQSVDMVAVLS
ncbi:transglutaminase family protein [Thalassobaculum sp. OXR-137]|uniref:transglutaminase family protein n=1 Tax=Thalassobaculum sp. OXR-137 TaxID=3100173 RepID=UPI002AC93BF2|nr:transglutaminase family protein [Thalassobaculum sp. OXR-137]WPZ33757.1 transglutaminase family protein [Thalassobaculum sp. OXR-137]